MKYVIKKGEHYSNHIFRPYLGFKKKFDITVQFTDSCRYNLNSADQKDINKLFGVSFGLHQQNSIRIGWNYNDFTDKINLFWYVYESGVRSYGQFSSCFIDEITDLKLFLGNNTFILESNSETFYRSYVYPSLKVGYYLYPYFGGNNPAPHDMTIYMSVI